MIEIAILSDDAAMVHPVGPDPSALEPLHPQLLRFPDNQRLHGGYPYQNQDDKTGQLRLPQRRYLHPEDAPMHPPPDDRAPLASTLIVIEQKIT